MRRAGREPGWRWPSCPGSVPAQARRLAERAGGPEAACALSPAALARRGLDGRPCVAGWPGDGARGRELRAARASSAPRCARGTSRPTRRACGRSPTRRSCSPSAATLAGRRAAPWRSSARGARAATAGGSPRSWRSGLAAVGLTVVSGLATGHRRRRPPRRARGRGAHGRRSWPPGSTRLSALARRAGARGGRAAARW